MITFVGNFSDPIPNGAVYIAVAIAVAVALTMYLLRAIGIYKLSKRAKLKSAFLAFIPFVWMFPACKLVKESRFLGTTIGKIAWALTLVCALTEILMVAYEFLIYFPYIGNFLAGRNIYVVADEAYLTGDMFILFDGLGIYGKAGEFVNPYTNIYLLQKILNGIYYVQNILSLLHVIIVVTVYIALFRKYWPQHFMLAAIFSIFGLDGPFIFAIRNKEPINYMDYLRSRYQGYYQNPYGPFGPQGGSFYGGNTQNTQNQRAPEEPFDEFQDKKDKKPDEPFSDF